MRSIVLASCLAIGSLAAAQDRLDDPIAEHVQTTLRSEYAALVPGKTQFIGVTLRMDPGWHVYWLNPGDSGLPVSIAVEAKGATAGEALFPAPQRYEHEGGELLDFVYHGEVTFLIPVTVPEDASGEASFKVRVSWLVCKMACVPGSAERSLTVPIRASRGEPVDAARFAATRARLPGAPPQQLATRWEGTRLVIEAPTALRLVAYPLLPEPTPPEGLIEGGQVQGDTLRLDYPARLAPGATVKVLVEADHPTAGRKPATSYFWVETQAPQNTPRKE